MSIIEEKKITSDVLVIEDDSSMHNPSVAEQVAEYGDDDERLLAKDFKTRHVSMIAISGAIGTGLIIGSGIALSRGGPASLFLGYLITGAILMVVLLSLGERWPHFLPWTKHSRAIRLDTLILLWDSPLVGTTFSNMPLFYLLI